MNHFEVPINRADAEARLGAAEVPASVLEVVRGLQAGGHQAVLVGGCVRDCLLGRNAGDWDLATSARPEQVQACFRKTIPTGLDHGTVTVVVGRGHARTQVEVTTFRGEGAYTDGRRPEGVEFLSDLVGDLERRDFTINALAFDPIEGRLTDAFGGLEDLREGVVRAVGTPLRRLREDGLRTMRAVRFAAVLGFKLAVDTETAIPDALDVFVQVSRERVRVELLKLLGSPRPSLGLRPMASTGLWPLVLTELSVEATQTTIDAVDEFVQGRELALVRLTRCLAASAPAEAAAALDNLKLSRAERSLIDLLRSPAIEALANAEGDEALRRAAARVGRERLPDAFDYLRFAADRRRQAEAICQRAVLSARELVVQGRDLIQAGLIKPGPEMGRVLAGLFEECLVSPERNTRAVLLARAGELVEG